VPAHEAGDPMTSYTVASLKERLVHPWAAVDAAALGVNRLDLQGERFVLA
jgi:hypothetical protein